MTTVTEGNPTVPVGQDGPADAPKALSFSSGAACHLVHRRTVSEVLITDWCETGPDTFECGAQWSRSHSFYRVRDGRHDPLLVAETLRQAGILLCHVAYGVPMDHSFLMDRLALEVEPGGLEAGGAPANVVVRIAAAVQRRSRSLSDLHLNMEFLREGQRVARGIGWVRCAGPKLYDRLRSRVAEPGVGPVVDPAPVDKSLVGLTDPGDVVLGLPVRAGEWPVRAPLGHPVLFDHPLDHVPGMLVFEAMRQAGRVLLGWPSAQPVATDVDFSRFIELSRSCSVQVELQNSPPGQATLAVRAVQGGNVAAEGVLTLAEPAGG